MRFTFTKLFLPVMLVFCAVSMSGYVLAAETLPLDYLNRSLNTLLKAEGKPDDAGMLGFPHIMLEYRDRTINGVAYNIYYTATGPKVTAVEYLPADSAGLVYKTLPADYDFIGMLGKTRNDVLAAMDLPHTHLMRPYGKMEEMIYFYDDAFGARLCLSLHLEKGAVHSAAYLFNGGIKGDNIVPFIHIIKDKFTPYFNDTVWVEQELDFRDTPEDGRYNLVRIAAGTHFDISFMALGVPHRDEFDLAVTFVDGDTKSRIGKLQIQVLNNFVRDHWRDEAYINSGNYEAFKTLNGTRDYR